MRKDQEQKILRSSSEIYREFLAPTEENFTESATVKAKRFLMLELGTNFKKGLRYVYDKRS